MQVPTLQQYEAQQAQLAALQEQVAGLHYTSAEVVNRTYHLGSKPTPGRAYDDRLTTRLGLGRTKLLELCALGPHKGGLRRQRAGDKWLVSELAVREWLGEPAFQAQA